MPDRSLLHYQEITVNPYRQADAAIIPTASVPGGAGISSPSMMTSNDLMASSCRYIYQLLAYAISTLGTYLISPIIIAVCKSLDLLLSPTIFALKTGVQLAALDLTNDEYWKPDSYDNSNEDKNPYNIINKGQKTHNFIYNSFRTEYQNKWIAGLLTIVALLPRLLSISIRIGMHSVIGTLALLQQIVIGAFTAIGSFIYTPLNMIAESVNITKSLSKASYDEQLKTFFITGKQPSDESRFSWANNIENLGRTSGVTIGGIIGGLLFSPLTFIMANITSLIIQTINLSIKTYNSIYKKEQPAYQIQDDRSKYIQRAGIISEYAGKLLGIALGSIGFVVIRAVEFIKNFLNHNNNVAKDISSLCSYYWLHTIPKEYYTDIVKGGSKKSQALVLGLPGILIALALNSIKGIMGLICMIAGYIFNKTRGNILTGLFSTVSSPFTMISALLMAAFNLHKKSTKINQIQAIQDAIQIDGSLGSYHEPTEKGFCDLWIYDMQQTLKQAAISMCLGFFREKTIPEKFIDKIEKLSKTKQNNIIENITDAHTQFEQELLSQLNKLINSSSGCFGYLVVDKAYNALKYEKQLKELRLAKNKVLEYLSLSQPDQETTSEHKTGNKQPATGTHSSYDPKTDQNLWKAFSIGMFGAASGTVALYTQLTGVPILAGAIAGLSIASTIAVTGGLAAALIIVAACLWKKEKSKITTEADSNDRLSTTKGDGNAQPAAAEAIPMAQAVDATPWLEQFFNPYTGASAPSESVVYRPLDSSAPLCEVKNKMHELGTQTGWKALPTPAPSAPTLEQTETNAKESDDESWHSYDEDRKVA